MKLHFLFFLMGFTTVHPLLRQSVTDEPWMTDNNIDVNTVEKERSLDKGK